jgi:hypothetical protein
METAKATPQEVDGFGWWLLVVASTTSRTIGRPVATRIQESLSRHHSASAWDGCSSAESASL